MAYGRDSATLDGQLEFVAYELCNAYEGVGMALKQAKTAGEASEAVEHYVKQLNEDRSLSERSTTSIKPAQRE
jgi:hypothetical protein